MRRPLRLLGETLLWALVLVGLWIATLTTVDGVELVAAAVCGLACGTLATATRATLGATLRPRTAWAGWVLRLPGAVLADSARLAVAVVRSRRNGVPLGTSRSLSLPAESPVHAGTRRALGAIAVSSTPGSYVVAVDEDGFTLHALTTRLSALERAVSR